MLRQSILQIIMLRQIQLRRLTNQLTIVCAICSYIENELTHRDWDLHVQEIANGMNNSEHTSTGQVPNVVVFGQSMPQRGCEYDDFIDINPDKSRNKSTFDRIRCKVQEYLPVNIPK